MFLIPICSHCFPFIAMLLLYYQNQLSETWDMFTLSMTVNIMSTAVSFTLSLHGNAAVKADWLVCIVSNGNFTIIKLKLEMIDYKTKFKWIKPLAHLKVGLCAKSCKRLELFFNIFLINQPNKTLSQLHWDQKSWVKLGNNIFWTNNETRWH